MVPTLQSLAGAVVRRSWTEIEPATRHLIFDMLWMERLPLLASIPQSLVPRIKAFCATEQALVLDLPHLDGLDRRHVHCAAESLGIDHASSGNGHQRVLRLSKSTSWSWEFTVRAPQYPPRKRRYDRDRDDRDEAYFQVYFKYCAWGYASPEDMLEHEVDLRHLLDE